MRAQRRFILPARMALASLLAATALLGASVGAAAADPVTLDVLVGYQGFVKPGEWMPVTVVAKNSGPGIDGRLELQEVLNSQPGVSGFAVYQAPISLASGAVKRIRGYVAENATGSTVRARIVQNGRVIVSQDSGAGSATPTLIGVLSDQPTSLDGFAAVHPGSVAARVVHLHTEDIAESAIALRAFDILAIDDFATDSLTAGQRTAISDFVQAGGNLLLGTGAAWRKTLGGLSPTILPMAISGTSSASAAELGNSSVELAIGDAAQGHAWLASGSHPLLLERTVGAGRVTLATFDFNQESNGGTTLLRQIMARAIFRLAGTSQNYVQPFGGPGPMGFGSQPSISSKSNSLTPVLGNLPSLDLPSFQLTGGLVLLYVLLVGPVNYFVLGAMRRRALAWVTVPLIAVIAAGGAYGTGVLTKGRSVQANQVTILHLQPGWDHAYQETYNGIIAPSRGDYQATVAGPRLLISPIATYGGYGGGAFGPGVIQAGGGFAPSAAASIRVNVDSNGVTLPGMTAFVLGGFATETISPAPQLTAHLQLVNGTLTGTIENHSNLAFTDAVLIAGDSFQTFGALKPGATATISLELKPGNSFGQPVYSRIYSTGNLYGPQPSQPTETQRANYAKTQILSVLPTGASFNGAASPVAPLLVAWTHQSFQDITVNGSRPRSTALSAVALSLPVDQIGTGSLPAGVVSGRIVDAMGDTQGGPPGMLVMQSGSVTYEFAPQLASGTHLTSASMNSVNQYGGKFFGPPGSTGKPGDQTLHSEVWDWSHSAWTDVAFQNTGATAIPDSAVNPDTGLVRFRLSSNSGFMASTITLSGTIQ
jgi:hypothetical protein